jgi:hypothetical protein
VGRRAVLALAAAGALVGLTASPAEAVETTFTVDNAGADPAAGVAANCPAGALSGNCRLRDAVAAAKNHGGDDLIAFQLPFPATINLTHGALVYNPPGGTLTVEAGSGISVHQTDASSDVFSYARPIIIGSLAISGGKNGVNGTSGDVIVESTSITGGTGDGVISPGTVTVEGSTISAQNNGVNAKIVNIGTATGGSKITGMTGDGVLASTAAGVDTSSVTGVNGVVSNGTASVRGATVRGTSGDGLNAATSATIVNSVVTGQNSGVISSGTATLSGSTATGSSVDGVFAATTATLTTSAVTGQRNGVTMGSGSSTVQGSNVTGKSQNDVLAPGGATIASSTLAGGGGQGVNSNGGVSVTNSTITGNGGCGITASSATLVYATVAQNGGTGCPFNVKGSTLASFGSVLSAPPSGGQNCSLSGSTTSNGYNFSDDASCALAGTGDRQNAGDPLLAGLANNGGPTPTRFPRPGSPLINAIPPASCQADGATGITTDQIGSPRPQASGCDIGAIETSAVLPALPGTSAPVTPTAAVRPVVLTFAETNATFRVGSGATALTARGLIAGIGSPARLRPAPSGTTFTYSLSEPAKVAITISRLAPGRRQQGHCVARAHRGQRCAIPKRVGVLTRSAKAGSNSVPFSGRLGTRALRPGRYQATIVASVTGAPASAPRKLHFRIVR